MLIHWIAVYLVVNLGGIPSWKTGARLEWGTVRVTSLALGSAVGKKEKIGDEKAKKQKKFGEHFLIPFLPTAEPSPRLESNTFHLYPP